MNRARIGLLVAAAALAGVPAIASAQSEPDNQRHGERGDRGDNRGSDRGDRGAAPQIQDRRSMAPPVQAAAPAPEVQRAAEAPRAAAAQGYAERRMRDADRHYVADGDPASRRNAAPQQVQAPPPAQVQQQQAPQAQPTQRAPGVYGRFAGDNGQRRGDDRRDYRGDAGRNDNARNDNERRDSARDNDRRGNGYNGYRGNDGRGGNVQVWRGGQQARDYGRGGYDRPAWRNEWRVDRRYDWRNYRDQNRRLFHAPRYVPPRNYGWGYRAFSVGFRLDPYFFAPTYWLDNPWDYRLPPAYGPYRWVRYYNDVLLVDIETGEVVDVIRDFFW
jgi:hypothetical protein